MVNKVQNPVLERIPLIGPTSVTVREFRMPAFRYPWHQHPELELTWILRGSGLRYVGDSVEPFHAGDFCLIGAHLPHTWLTMGDDMSGVHSYVIQFDPTNWGKGFLELPEMYPIRKLFADAMCGLAFPVGLGRNMIRRFRRPLSPLQLLAELLRTLDELGNEQNARSLALMPVQTGRYPMTDQRLEKVLAFLGDNMSETVPHTEVARLAGLSPAAFSRYFRRKMGKTFQRYLSDMRLSEACRQLLETSKSIAEIAFDVGFQNLSTFNRSFRESRRMSPREFRTKAGKSDPALNSRSISRSAPLQPATHGA